MTFDRSDGWLQGCKHLQSPHFDQRPTGLAPDLIVVHCISLPEGCYGNGNVEALFGGTLNCSADPSFESLKDLRVSAHFLISRDGAVTQFVDIHDRAWHAGISSFQGRTSCNDFSVGIELEGCVADEYAAQQIEALATLCDRITKKIPSIRWVVGHSDIAPGRKADPGPRFPWGQFLRGCQGYGLSIARPAPG